VNRSALRIAFALALALAVALASGCSSGSAGFIGGDGGFGPGAHDPNSSEPDDAENTDDSNGDGGSRTAKDGGKKGDAQTTDGASAIDAGVDAAPTGPTKTGRISVGQTITIINSSEYYSSYATAMFTETQAGGAGGCTTTHIGSCDVYDCALDKTVDAGSVRYAGAGDVDVTGGFTDYSLSTSAGSYQTVSSQQLLYQGGTVLTVSATGDEVPAFSNKTITVPTAPFTVQSPSFASTLSLPRTQGLAVAWSGASGRSVKVNVSTIQQNVRSVSIACTFSGSAGSGSVPASGMGKLLHTSSSVTGSLYVSAPVETTFAAGQWSITFGLTEGGFTNAFTTSN
jgi:hypothetical protein